MTDWLKLNNEQRRASLEQAALNAGMQVKAVEKDWWVTLTLKALFTSKYKDYMIFKGGTSLSKCWKLIERFSEDIDIGLDSSAFGIKYKENPTGRFVKQLKKAGCDFTSNELKADLEKQFKALGVSKGIIKIEAAPVRTDMPDTDPQTLFVHYPSLFDADKYMADVVKIEVSVRSMKEPFSIVPVQSLLTEYFPNAAYPETPFGVTVVDPHRTFLEKMFLLHEEFIRPDTSKIRSERMSRHLYDLERMMDKDAGIKALADSELYVAIIKHRESYSRLSWVDYSTHGKDTIYFLPPPPFTAAYNKDYETMQMVMIYGESPSFDNLIKRLNELLERFRTKKN